MTISEAAKKYGVSRQTIYNRLQKQFGNVKALKDKDGNLNDKALEALSRLDVKEEIDVKLDVKKTSNVDDTIKTLNERIEDLKSQLEDAKKQRDQWAEEAANLRKLLDQAQQLHAMDQKRLEEGKIKTKILNLFGKKSGK